MLSAFVARKYAFFLEVSLWLNLVGFAITGAVIGFVIAMGVNPLSMFTDTYNNVGRNIAYYLIFTIIGFILGAIVGIITDIIFLGTLVIFVKMGKEVGEIKDNVKKLAASSTGGRRSN
jgi:uncharacterized metal-binding protein